MSESWWALLLRHMCFLQACSEVLPRAKRRDSVGRSNGQQSQHFVYDYITNPHRVSLVQRSDRHDTACTQNAFFAILKQRKFHV